MLSVEGCMAMAMGGRGCPLLTHQGTAQAQGLAISFTETAVLQAVSGAFLRPRGCLSRYCVVANRHGLELPAAGFLNVSFSHPDRGH